MSEQSIDGGVVPFGTVIPYRPPHGKILPFIAVKSTQAELDAHINDFNNPHNTTPFQVGNTEPQWNANSILDRPVDDSSIANNKVLYYNSSSGNIEYKTIDAIGFTIPSLDEVANAGNITTRDITVHNLIANQITSNVIGNVSGTSLTITGNIAESQVTNLVSDLALKAALASPTLTGIPTAPTASGGTNTTQLATTAFATTADNLKLNLSGGTMTGDIALGTHSLTATNYSINGSDGHVSLDNGGIISDGSGTLTSAMLVVSDIALGSTPPTGSIHYDGGFSFQGGVDINGTFGCDGGAISTDGSGVLTVSFLTLSGGGIVDSNSGNLSFNGGVAQIGSNGSLFCDNGAITSDGSGLLTATNFSNGVNDFNAIAVSLNDLSATLSSFVGDVTDALGNKVSTDSGLIGTDGNGDLTAVSLSANNPLGYGLSVIGQSTLDSGLITTDGSGNLTAATVQTYNVFGPAWNGGLLNFNGGLATIDSSGNLTANSITSDSGAITTNGSGQMTFTYGGSGPAIKIQGTSGSDCGYEVRNTNADQANAFFFNQNNDYVGIGIGQTNAYIQLSLPLAVTGASVSFDSGAITTNGSGVAYFDNGNISLGDNTGGFAYIDNSGNGYFYGNLIAATLSSDNGAITTDGSGLLATSKEIQVSHDGLKIFTDLPSNSSAAGLLSYNPSMGVFGFYNFNAGVGFNVWDDGHFNFGNSVTINSDGTTTLDGGAITTDGSGGFSAAVGDFRVDSTGNVTTSTADGGGNLSIGGTASFDGGTISTDGSGNLTVKSLSLNGSAGVLDVGFNSLISSSGVLVVGSPIQLDNGAITTDGNGDLSAAGIFSDHFGSLTGQAVFGDTVAFDNGAITTDGSGAVSGSNFQAKGNSTGSLTGAGIELFYDAGSTAGGFVTYDRTANAYISCHGDSLDYGWHLSGSPSMTLDSSGLLTVALFSSDSGQIYSDGSGGFYCLGITVDGNSTQGFVANGGSMVGDAVCGFNTTSGMFWSDNGEITSDGSGTLSATQFQSVYASSQSVSISGQVGFSGGSSTFSANSQINCYDGSGYFASNAINWDSSGNLTANTLSLLGVAPQLNSSTTDPENYAVTQLNAPGSSWQFGTGGTSSAFPNKFYVYDSLAGIARMVIDGTSGTTSLDSGAITTDGSGRVTVVDIETSNINYINSNDLTIWTAVTITGPTTLDGGAITTDGSGNMTVATIKATNGGILQIVNVTVDATTADTTSLYTVPTGRVALIENFSVITTDILTPGTAPTIEFGTSGTHNLFVPATILPSQNLYDRYRIDNPTNGVGAGTVITATVTSASTAATHTIQYIISVYLIAV